MIVAVETITANYIVLPRTQKIGRYFFTMSDNQTSNGWEINIKDFAEVEEQREIDGEIQPFFNKILISERMVYKSNEEIDYLFSQISALLPEGLSYTESEKVKRQLGLLFFMQNDFIDSEQTKTIYGILPSNYRIRDGI